MTTLTHFFLQPLSLPCWAVIIAGIIVLLLCCLCETQTSNARIWRMTCKVIAANAYKRGKKAAAESQKAPLNVQVAQAYERGRKDAHAEWTAAAAKHGFTFTVPAAEGKETQA